MLREKNGAQDTNGLNGLAFCLDCKTSRDKVGHLFYILLLPLCEMEKLLGSAVSALKGSLMRSCMFKVHSFITRQGSSPVSLIFHFDSLH
jgi:hypothetical protein